MNSKRMLFCEEYLIDLNATRAYKKVYQTDKDNSARANASKLLQKPEVKEYIEQRLEEIRQEKIANADEVLMTITDVMRTTTKDSDRLKAAELLSKKYGLLIEKIEQKTDANIIINIDGDFDDC